MTPASPTAKTSDPEIPQTELYKFPVGSGFCQVHRPASAFMPPNTRIRQALNSSPASQQLILLIRMERLFLSIRAKAKEIRLTPRSNHRHMLPKRVFDLDYTSTGPS